ncbi:glycosyltransferase family 4 protein [Methanoculleus horonobensis]|jgi:glycosyltransferase involved in cell wall biosynthesis|uniref:glycosyltransferase family 4 protein n=1 Tax=Methanoculleus horonobensis TaxID=528314 RepID=UPI0008318FDB|nr:glycosyltransferase family 4 protein [Methanoculleus horonobensis]
MNILAIPTTVGLSKPQSGGQNRFCNLVKCQAANNRIVVLEPDHLHAESDDDVARVYTYRDIEALRRKLSIFRDINPDFIRKTARIIRDEEIDLVQITHPSGAMVARMLGLLTRRKITIVYDAHNVESEFIQQTFANRGHHSPLERKLIPAYTNLLERVSCKYLFDHITAVSENDADTFRRKYRIKDGTISVISSGCSIRPQISDEARNKIREEMGLSPGDIAVFFHGLYGHPPNREAFDLIQTYIAPHFADTDPNVSFVVGGTQVPEFEEANVRSLGFIADIQNIAGADIAIVPLRSGGGTKLKIFDYMSAGLPIVTTKKGIEGIDAEHYEHAIIVDDIDEEFIAGIRYLIENKDERKRIGDNARALAEAKYDWRIIGGKLEDLYRTLVSKSGARHTGFA